MSIDNVVIDYYISGQHQRDSLISSLQDVSLKNQCELTHWENYKIGGFRHQITISFPDKTSFWIGIGLNQAKTNWGRVRIDFNPNKIAIHNCFREILAFLNAHSRAMHTKIPRFDLAIDIPIVRDSVFLVKDKRLYSERRHGSEYTQYLGKKSNEGHVKLYNKQAESKLAYPLTRLELTLDPDEGYESINLPTVYYVKQIQISFDEIILSDTDRFILNALLQGCGSLSQLNRKTRAKMENIMENYVDHIRIDQKQYDTMRQQLRLYKEYPRFPLDEKDIETDRVIITHQDNSDKFVEIRNTVGLPFD